MISYPSFSRRKLLYLGGVAALLGACSNNPSPPPPPRNLQWTVTNQTVTVTCDERSGSAIRTVTVRGYQMVQSPDHGAQIQTACSMNGLGEQLNPTEAGSVPDGDKPTSSSKILGVTVSGQTIQASSQLCYWYPYQGQTLSPITLDKKIELGWNGMWNVIKDSRTLHNPNNYDSCQFECLTGYLNMTMNQLYSFDRASGQLTLTPYQNSTVFDPTKIVSFYAPATYPILSLPDASQAMGVVVGPGMPGTGCWMGAGNYSNKWSSGQGFTPWPPGAYSWNIYMVVGTLEEVRQTMVTLISLI